MKAIVQDRYGSPDVLQLKDVDTPVAADNQVLVRVHAAAVKNIRLSRNATVPERFVSRSRATQAQPRQPALKMSAPLRGFILRVCFRHRGCVGARRRCGVWLLCETPAA